MNSPNKKKFLEDIYNENEFKILHKKIKRNDSNSNEKEDQKRKKISKNVNPKNEIKNKKARKIKFKDLSDSSSDNDESETNEVKMNVEEFQNCQFYVKNLYFQEYNIKKIVKYNLKIFIKLIILKRKN